MEKKPIIFTSECSIKAAAATAEGEEPKLPTFEMKAYNGGVMSVDYWGPVVVDLAGMQVSDKTPILFNHDKLSIDSILGQSIKIDKGNTLSASGTIMGESDTAKKVVGLAKNGFGFQASIGADPLRYEEVESGGTAEANGQTFEGPFTLVTASQLKEISILSLGADSTTETKIAAKQTQESKMDPKVEKKTEEPTAEQIRAQAVSEQNRIMKVQAAAKDHPEICAKAVEAGWGEAETSMEVLKAENKQLHAKIKADEENSKRPENGGPAVVNGSVPMEMKTIEAAASMRNNLKNIEAKYDSETLNKAQDLKINSLTDMVKAALAMEGKTLDCSRHETEGFLRAAFSTRSIGNIVSNLANKFILEGYGTVEETWRKVASIRPVVDFKANTGNRLVMGNLLQALGPGGEISHGELSDETRSVQASTKALMLGITREDIINDDLGALTDLPRRLGYAAARTFNTDFWAAFEAAVATLFTDARANTQTGGALSIANLKTAEKLFLELEDADGNPLGTDPSVLLVSPTNSAAAREIFASTNLITGEDATTTSANIYSGMFEPAVSRYLTAAPWYLLADPMAMPVMEVAFLNGRQEPFVETADADFNTLGVQMRCFYDYGAAAAEWRAGVRSDS